MSGTYTYTFTHLTDAHYSKVPLKGSKGSGEYTTTQRVHPLAIAQFVKPGAGRHVVTNCEGNVVDFEIDLRVSAIVSSLTPI